ncbi:MAG: YitT family protein [Chitinophagaceae bacterium]|nr:YitT family protein [Chitinophagaceae bacterium]
MNHSVHNHHEKLILRQLFTPKTFLLLVMGVLCAAFALKGFMIPNGFLDGGVTGISLLIHELFHVSFNYPMIIINLLFLIPAWKFVGKLFAIRSFIAIVMLALAVSFLPIEKVTQEPMLVALFGGCIIGVGMGLVMRSGAAIDGFEVLAVFTTRKIGFSTSEVILFFNSIIFLTAAFKFGLNIAFYGIITYYTALKMVEYVVDGIEEYISLTIISKESEKIKSLISNHFKKGLTVYKGERGYLPGAYHVHTDCDVIVTIVTRLELLNMNTAILRIDPNAFMYTHTIKETMGGVLKPKVTH